MSNVKSKKVLLAGRQVKIFIAMAIAGRGLLLDAFLATGQVRQK